jgi:hypothetical protein
MPAFTAAQTHPVPAQAVHLSVRASFSMARQVPPPAQAARLGMEDFPDVHLSAAQQVPQPGQAPRLVPARWRGPAEPRPPGVPATPRPVVTP